MPGVPRGTDRLVVVISDVEMGAGGPLDDFPHSDYLAELMLSYNQGPCAGIAVDLVFNGDTFDLLKTSYLDGHPRHISRDVALGKMSRVAAAHPLFFSAVRHFLAHEGAPRHVHFLAGNHDPELLFPEVENLVRSLCGGSERIHFPGLELDFGRVHIEHGNQSDPLFSMDAEAPFLESGGETNEPILNIPWASVALLDVAMPLQPLLHFHDRLVPKRYVMQLIPEIKELLLSCFWRYWTRDYWKGARADPVKRLTWTMLTEIGGRLISHDPEVSAIGGAFQKRMRESDDYDVYVVGHVHEASWWSYGHRRVLQAGCLRNEYMVVDGGQRLVPIPKSYVEVYLRGDEPLRSHLVELETPTPPAGYLPGSIFDVRDGVCARLAPPSEQAQQHAAQAKQAAREAKAVAAGKE